MATTWLFLALPWSKYTCARCGAIYAGTLLRLVSITIAVGVLGYFVIRALKGKTDPAVLAPLVVLSLVLILCRIPGQLKRIA